MKYYLSWNQILQCGVLKLAILFIFKIYLRTKYMHDELYVWLICPLSWVRRKILLTLYLTTNLKLHLHNEVYKNRNETQAKALLHIADNLEIYRKLLNICSLRRDIYLQRTIINRTLHLYKIRLYKINLHDTTIDKDTKNKWNIYIPYRVEETNKKCLLCVLNNSKCIRKS